MYYCHAQTWENLSPHAFFKCVIQACQRDNVTLKWCSLRSTSFWMPYKQLKLILYTCLFNTTYIWWFCNAEI